MHAPLYSAGRRKLWNEAFPKKRKKIQEENELAAVEETETASEGEGSKWKETDFEEKISSGIRKKIELPCCHRFSVQSLLMSASTEATKKEYLSFHRVQGLRNI